jgi:calcineurin-like phosphoesterase family protein
MNKALIDNWNTYVTNHDEVYILGDFMHKGNGKTANEILSRLKGKKYLIKGNHENYLSDPQFNLHLFEWIKDYHAVTLDGIKFILFHYPILEWDNYFRGSIHLYGHVHNSGIKHPEYGEKLRLLGPRAFNIGVDVNDFYPLSIKTIIGKIETAKAANGDASNQNL